MRTRNFQEGDWLRAIRLCPNIVELEELRQQAVQYYSYKISISRERERSASSGMSRDEEVRHRELDRDRVMAAFESKREEWN